MLEVSIVFALVVTLVLEKLISHQRNSSSIWNDVANLMLRLMEGKAYLGANILPDIDFEMN